MASNIYKPRLYRIVANLVIGLFFAGFGSFIIVMFFFRQNPIPFFILFFVIIYVLDLWLIVFSNMIVLEVTDDSLVVKRKGKKMVYSFTDTSFRATIKNQGQSDSSYELYAILKDGREELIDCELIGGSQFDSLLCDLKIIGDEAEVNKLDTEK